MPSGNELLSIIREVACEHFGEPEAIDLLGTATHKLTYPDRYIKVRHSGVSGQDLWFHRQLPHVPRILKVVKHRGARLKFVEWWSGEHLPVHVEETAELPIEHFRKYGDFVKRLQWRGFYLKDDSWKNVIWSPDRDAVWNCDMHSLQWESRGYLGIIKRRVTPEQWEAFEEGFATTKDDLVKLASHMGPGFLTGPHYQPIDVAGCDIRVPGKRSTCRFELMNTSSLEGKRVLDLGCGRGMCCFEAAGNRADYVLGIENGGKVPYTLAAWNKALATYAGWTDIDFRAFDLDLDWEVFADCTRNVNWDVVFCFAVVRHIKNSDRLMKYIDKTTDLMYFEGQLSETREQVEDKIKQTTTFTEVEYLGNASKHDLTPCVRHLYRCSR